MESHVRQVLAVGGKAEEVSKQLVDQLRAPDLRLAIVFSDWQLDAEILAKNLHHGLTPASVVGGTTIGVVARGARATAGDAPPYAAVAMGLYGSWVRVGVGLAREVSGSALGRSRDAVQQALAGLRRTPDTLDPERHVGITLFDGTCGHEEAFCIGTAVAAPAIRFVGGATSTEQGTTRRPFVWVDGEVVTDAGLVLLLESLLPFHAVTSAPSVPTKLKAVVTATSSGGRVIAELDGRPAARRLQELISALGEELDASRPSEYSLARYVDDYPYVRSMTRIDETGIHLASGVESGQVLRVMRPGNLIGTTRRDLALAAQKVGGSMAGFLAFSCTARHWEASARGLVDELADVYAQYPTIGTWSFGEQTGMLLVNHTLTGLAIGEATRPDRRASAQRGGEP